MPAGLATPFALALALALAGAILAVAGWLAIRSSGARPDLGRRLGGAREVRVGKLHDLEVARALPGRPVRVVGRVRCSDPIVTPEGDRLVAFHRDVEIELPRGGWRSIEKLRETRSFELWDHDGWLTVDPAEAAEPLVVIPHVWEGSAADLEGMYQGAVARLSVAGSSTRARSVTRTLNVVDKLLVLAEVRGAEEGRTQLVPPPGGYLFSSLDLDAAMRILGGGRPLIVVGGMAAIGLGGALVATGLVLGSLTLLPG